MKSIKEIKNLKGKKVLVRVDFNVPVSNGKVSDDFRIKKALPTILFLQKKGAKVILISHLGKGSSASGTGNESLLPVSVVLNKYVRAKFVRDISGEDACEAIFDLQDGEVLLLENLRNDIGEQKNDKNFAKNLSKLADIYVNEAFSVSHRDAASVVALPKLLPSYAGFQMDKEIKNLNKVVKNPKHPFLFILGGAKFSTKMPLIKKYLKTADYVFIGGAMLNDFLKAKGYEVGKSLVDSRDYGIEKILNNKKIILPIDVVVLSNGKLINKKVTEVGKEDVILDVGLESVKNLETYIKKMKLILWNGPLGKYEDGGDVATKKILKIIANTKTVSIIGGGDTVNLISKMKLEDKFTFVSTGGGATLEYLTAGTLPGIKVLK